MSKLSRQKVIQDIVAKKTVASQDDLRLYLSRRGHAVTQATLSRDIHELGLVKTPDGYSFLPDERGKGPPGLGRAVGARIRPGRQSGAEPGRGPHQRR